MRLHNLGTVIAFEVRRTLTKPTFWLTSLSIPLLMGIVFALIWFSNAATIASVDAQSERRLAFTYTDASGIVEPDVAARLGGTLTPDAAGAAQAVREGRAHLHIDIPADPSTDPVLVVGEDQGLVGSGQWTSIAQQLLRDSASERIGDPVLTSVLAGVSTQTELWKDGEQAEGFGAAILPGLFLVLLYMGVLMLGQQMINITVEEKENRVTEMILTTIDPRVLIVGKVIAVLLVGLVQGLVLVVPAMIAAVVLPGLLGGTAAAAPGEAAAAAGFVSDIVVDPLRIVLAAALFTGGFLLFTGLLVAIGAVMPTAKDAGSAFGMVVLAMFLPLYMTTMVLNNPDGLVSQFLTWFPLTSPVTALLRNAMGSFPLPQALGVVVWLLLFATLLLWLGVKLFRQGSISYDKRLSILKTLRSSR